MKTIYFKSGLLFAAVAMLFAACDSDRDDNPILDTDNMPSQFVLNTPAYATQLTDLATSSTVNFSWSQPAYGFAAPTTYTFQISTDDTWNDAVLNENGDVITPATYLDLAGSFTTVTGGVNANAINNAILELKGWNEDSTLPASMDIYMRCKAMLADTSVPSLYSNSVKLVVVPSKPSSSFDEFVYAIGDDSSWSTVHKLRSALDENDMFNGEYRGFGFLNTEFKFRSHEDSWDAPDWGFLEDGKLEAQAGNIAVPAPGFYMIEMSLVDLSYKITAVNSISIVGSGAGGWENDLDLTYDEASGAWKGTVNLEDGEIKFRMNHDWTINWGGDVNGLTQDGANIEVTAGTYSVELYVTYEGDSKVKLSK